MNKDQLLKRLSGIEWDDFEAKEARVALPDDIAKTISAFANTIGGYVVFGVKETSGKFVIGGVENPDKIQNDFISLLRGEKFNIPLSSKGDIHRIDGKVVLVFRIEEMPRQAKPVYFGGDIRNTFVRLAASTQKASRSEVERMLREASEKTSDSMRLEDFDIEDLDNEAIEMFRNILKLEHPDHPFTRCGKIEMLLGLQAIDGTKKKKHCLTAAGLLLFGKELRILNQFPSYFIDFLVIPAKHGEDVQTRWVERYSSEQGIIQTYVQIYDRLRKRIPVPFALKADGYTRNDDPPSVQAAREALVNLLMHMDFFDAKGAVVKCYDDRILFRNAGCLRFSIDRIEQHLTEPRNPVIAKVFRLLGWADRSGSGIEKITKGWMSMGYGKPVFQDDKPVNMFEVIFPLTKPGKSSTAQEPHKYHTSTTQAPHKSAVVKFCVEPRSFKEIMEHLGLRNRVYVFKDYVSPLVDEGLIALTIPEKPKSPRQRYLTTDKGRQSLGA
ncbi:MAG: putative DNA binding domain-containing protein [Candidatus Omnitrophica bacterium]|nr:putative DNA binding domain-containing protein [Candidatus Omnitrophota bacterium]